MFVERERYLGFGNRFGRKIGRNIGRQKKMLKEYIKSSSESAREHGEDDLCQTKSWGEERMLWSDESEVVKVTVDD